MPAQTTSGYGYLVRPLVPLLLLDETIERALVNAM
jgi:hypothetical protein